MNKGLEALNRIGNMPTQNDVGLVMINTLRDYGIIEKELKAFEIIKNSGVFVHLLQQSRNVEEYNSLMLIAFKAKAERDYKGAVKKFCLTQEEYDLLKEVLL